MEHQVTDGFLQIGRPICSNQVLEYANCWATCGA